MRRALYVLGAVLIVAGALVAALSTGGFDQVVADRAVTVDVAGESQAYLAIDSDAYDPDVTTTCFGNFCFQWPPHEVADLENRFTDDYETVSFQIADVQGETDDVFTVSTAYSPSELPEGDEGTLRIDCSGDVTAQGETDVVFEVAASGPSIDIQTTTVVEGVSYDCQET